MSTHRQRRRSARRGQIIVLGSVMVVAIGVMAALALDVGYIVTAQARLRNVSDAAALAAAQVLLDGQVAGAAEADARAAALAEAERLRVANWSGVGLSVEFGELDQDGDFAELPTDTAATAVQARAFRNPDAPDGELNLFFAPLAGVDACSVTTSACAQTTDRICGVLTGLRPFAIPEEKVAAPGEEIVFYPAGEGGGPGKGEDKVAPGNWGLLNLNGGSCGTPELRDWILNGYSTAFTIDPDVGHVWIDGTPGFRATVESEVQQIIGQCVFMVIFDEVTGSGSNADYRCVGFLRATVTGCDLHGPDAHMSCDVAGVESVHDLVTGGSNESPNVRKIQLVR
jgi:hypothetical protein